MLKTVSVFFSSVYLYMPFLELIIVYKRHRTVPWSYCAERFFIKIFLSYINLSAFLNTSARTASVSSSYTARPPATDTFSFIAMSLPSSSFTRITLPGLVSPSPGIVGYILIKGGFHFITIAAKQVAKPKWNIRGVKMTFR